MARRVRAPNLETRTARLKLSIRRKPYYVRVSEGASLGYRRCQGNGSWSLRKANGKSSSWIKRVAPADDYEGIPGALSYWDALAKVRELAHGRAADDGIKLQTVAEALASYRADLEARGGGGGNVSVLEHHVPASLASKIVATLNARELRSWRDGLIADGLAPGSVTRYCKSFKAALNLAAAHDPARISNMSAWRVGLASLPDSAKARNVILTDGQVRDLVTAGYDSPALGLYLEVGAVTGARPIQLQRLVGADVLRDRLLMPSSKKGRGRRRIERKPVPIPEGLAARLRALAKSRGPDAPLLVQDDGRPWTSRDHREPVRAAVKTAGLDPKRITYYSLRHSSIVRALTKGVPIRIVASTHDTSVAEIERTYSKYISDHTDALTRAALIDLGEAHQQDNVVRLPR
jgi:integrase